jgi:probable phosphoglycerate mutase
MVRHAPTAWTPTRRLQGRLDVPLSPEGRTAAQTWRLPADLARCAADGRLGWATSPLARAVETARALGAANLVVEPRLVERDWGAWTGLRPEATDPVPPGEAWTHRPPGGESAADVLARVRAWLDGLAESDGPATWVAISHGGVIETLLAATLRWDLRDPAPVRVLPGRLHRVRRRADGVLQLTTLNEPLAPPP